MFKQLISSLFSENSAPPPSSSAQHEFVPEEFSVQIIGYHLPEIIQKQLKSLRFPKIQFTENLAEIQSLNKAKQEFVLIFPIRLPNTGAKEFVKALRDENPTLTTQLIVITDKLNKEELISLFRQRINGFLLLPLSKTMIGHVFSRLNILPETLKPKVGANQ